MSILPWDNFIRDCYIRLENLVIDGSTKELEEEWSLEGLELDEIEAANSFLTQRRKDQYKGHTYSGPHARSF